MSFLKRRHSSFCSSANDCAKSSSATFRRTGTRSVAAYSVILSLLFAFQAGLRHPSYSEMTNEVPPELASGRPVEDPPKVVTMPKNDEKAPQISAKRRDDDVTSTGKNYVSINEHAITHIGNGNRTNIPTIPVVVWPYVERGPKNAVSKHLVENGVNESTYLELSNDLWNFDSNVVWVGDIGFGPKNWCNTFHKRIVEAKERRATLGLPLQWPVFIIDWADFGNKRQCANVEKEMGSDFVKYSQRSIVKGRKWNKQEGWVQFGQRWKDSDLATHRHMPYFVRTDTIETLDGLLKEKYNMTLASPIETLERKIDVTHFWPRDMKGVRNVHCNLRKKVSRVVEETGTNASLTTFVGLAGKAVKEGRNGVHSAYIETMLDSSIIVVAQRDNWEDHYRLFEALVSGAMVMTDRMFSLPHGLENGTSVIEFQSAEDLRSKILYYSSHPEERVGIARKGREVSMLQHRTWHRIEEVIFGKSVSDCSNVPPGNPCPYIVHANEAGQGRIVHRNAL